MILRVSAFRARNDNIMMRLSVILIEMARDKYHITSWKMGWLKGLEPSTTGITIRGSTN